MCECVRAYMRVCECEKRTFISIETGLRFTNVSVLGFYISLVSAYTQRHTTSYAIEQNLHLYVRNEQQKHQQQQKHQKPYKRAREKNKAIKLNT